MYDWKYSIYRNDSKECTYLVWVLIQYACIKKSISPPLSVNRATTRIGINLRQRHEQLFLALLNHSRSKFQKWQKYDILLIFFTQIKNNTEMIKTRHWRYIREVFLLNDTCIGVIRLILTEKYLWENIFWRMLSFGNPFSVLQIKFFPKYDSFTKLKNVVLLVEIFAQNTPYLFLFSISVLSLKKRCITSESFSRNTSY